MMCRNHRWNSIEGWGPVFMEIAEPCRRITMVKITTIWPAPHSIPWGYWAPPYGWPPSCSARWSRGLDLLSGSDRHGPPGFLRSPCAPEREYWVTRIHSHVYNHRKLFEVTLHRQMVNYRDFFALIVGAPRQGDTDAPALSVLAVKHNHLRSQIYKSLVWMRAVQIVCFIWRRMMVMMITMISWEGVPLSSRDWFASSIKFCSSWDFNNYH